MSSRCGTSPSRVTPSRVSPNPSRVFPFSHFINRGFPSRPLLCRYNIEARYVCLNIYKTKFVVISTSVCGEVCCDHHCGRICHCCGYLVEEQSTLPFIIAILVYNTSPVNLIKLVTFEDLLLLVLSVCISFEYHM